MALPHIVAEANNVPVGESPLPSGAQTGDLIVYAVYSTITIHHVPSWQGRHGNAGVIGASAPVVLTAGDSWTEEIPNKYEPGGYRYRGEQLRLQVRVGTITGDPAEVRLSRTAPRNGSAFARVLIVRDGRGAGATVKSSWRVPTESNQSLGLFFGGGIDVPAGVTPVVGNVWSATSTGPHAGPGGAMVPSAQHPQHLAYLGGLEILGTTGPGVPVLREPADGSESANGVPIEFAWAHQSARPGGFQDAYRFRAGVQPEDPTQDPTYMWWDGTSMVPAETSVASTATRVQLPASVAGEDATLEWTVATREGLDGEWSNYATSFTTSTVEPPTATVTGPTGAVHNTMRPVITWQATAAAGKVLVGYHARLVGQDETVVFDTGAQQGSPGQYATPALPDWVNGGTYTPQVRDRKSTR